MLNPIGEEIAYLRQAGVFVGGIALAGGVRHIAAPGAALQPQDPVLFVRREALRSGACPLPSRAAAVMKVPRAMDT